MNDKPKQMTRHAKGLHSGQGPQSGPKQYDELQTRGTAAKIAAVPTPADITSASAAQNLNRLNGSTNHEIVKEKRT